MENSGGNTQFKNTQLDIFKVVNDIAINLFSQK